MSHHGLFYMLRFAVVAGLYVAAAKAGLSLSVAHIAAPRPPRLRPAELASRGVDPLGLGKEALHLLARLHLRGADQLAMREQVGELVRQLAWGTA
jgi:hypothetical protein